MKKFLRNFHKQFLFRLIKFPIKHLEVKEEKNRFLDFKNLKKTRKTFIGDNLVSLYEVPVKGCADAFKFKNEIVKATQKHFSSNEKWKDWSFYDIEDNKVLICKINF